MTATTAAGTKKHTNANGASSPARAQRSHRVALLVNLAKNAPKPDQDAPHDALADLDSEKSAIAYEQALRDAGHDVFVQEGGPHLAAWLREIQPDICLNTCEGFIGESREAQVPALLEMLGARYSGPGPLAAALTFDKPITKQILSYHGLPTPLYQVFERADAPLHPALEYPLFVKPAHEGTGMGIGR